MFSIDQLRIFTEPQQGATYDELLAVAQRAEQLGFGAFFRSDHYLAMGGALEAGGLPGPTDAWTTLAGLARDTSTIRLGTLVTSATFRLPGPLAITVAQVDQMSGGRVELGIGAGWYEQEHQAYGIPFPPLGERFDRLEEQLAVITGLWSTPVGETFSLRRRALPGHRLAGAARSRCRRAACRSSSAAAGPQRTPALAARYAAEFNTPFLPVERFVEQRGRVGGGVRGDRPRPGVAALLGGGRRVRRRRRGRVRAAGRGHRPRARRAARATASPARPTRSRATLERWADAGAERLYLQVLDLADLDHLDAIAALAA